eukprot:Nk52_evm40s239 gene=Nk52_evmTU40s239
MTAFYEVIARAAVLVGTVSLFFLSSSICVDKWFVATSGVLNAGSMSELPKPTLYLGLWFLSVHNSNGLEYRKFVDFDCKADLFEFEINKYLSEANAMYEAGSASKEDHVQMSEIPIPEMSNSKGVHSSEPRARKTHRDRRSERKASEIMKDGKVIILSGNDCIKYNVLRVFATASIIPSVFGIILATFALCLNSGLAAGPLIGFITNAVLGMTSMALCIDLYSSVDQSVVNILQYITFASWMPEASSSEYPVLATKDITGYGLGFKFITAGWIGSLLAGLTLTYFRAKQRFEQWDRLSNLELVESNDWDVNHDDEDNPRLQLIASVETREHMEFL